MGIIKAFKLGFDYLKYDEDGNVQDRKQYVWHSYKYTKRKSM